MKSSYVDQAIELLEKANANLEPELLAARDARKLLDSYAQAQRLAGYGVTALARKVDDAAKIASVTGTSMGKAKDTVATAKVLRDSPELSAAMQQGEVSLDQAKEIASAVESVPGAAKELLHVAKDESFHVLKEKARKAKLEAEQHKDLADRQRCARSARSYSDELGMTTIHLSFEPHVGTPIVARAEAEAERLAKRARARDGKDNLEPFDRCLADAYAALLSGKAKGRARRPELVILVSHEVATRGWKDVRKGEVCKIPGVGPVPPQVARDIGKGAFLNGVVCDGIDLRQFKRWSRHIPIEVSVALELGQPPEFDGVGCVDCGNRFRTEIDHVTPRHRGGETSNGNLRPRCWNCHQVKTAADRKNGKLKPPDS
jgi:HNH endonuclease